MARILLVEDDESIVSSLSAFLAGEGFETEHADGRRAALRRLGEETFDLVLLDVLLRDGDGFSLCREIRERYLLPVIFLTASGDEGSTVSGLELGAEDYVAKPFRPRELLSRIRGVLRRCGKENRVIALGRVFVDTDRGAATKDGEPLPLSALEYRILLTFAQNKGKLLSRERLLDEIWDAAGDFVNDNTLTVYIKRLREKIEDDPASPSIIKTVRGLGYRVD
ncbi:MAG: response regulator transcription factor [Clostridia bacterium]|nr:response regulator transcription factor [Clostridia bacterium]